MAIEDEVRPGTHYPSGPERQSYDTKRKRRATIWGLVFMACTMVGIVALTALLFNIMNQSFGYVAVQNEIDPEFLVMRELEKTLLSAPNTVSSEDDLVLADGVASDPYAIGYFGYAYFDDQADRLRALSINGVPPNTDSVHSGDYELSRPLYIYTSAGIMEEKPQVAAFVEYYLANVNRIIEEVGYFPVSQADIDAGAQTVSEATKEAELTGDSSQQIRTAGSSTVAPVTIALAEEFRSAGHSGEIEVDVVGTTAGFQRFCVDKDIDVANASRAMNRLEMEVCRKTFRESPLELRVGTDAIAVVVSHENDFLTELSQGEVQAIFAGAEKWSDVNDSWPDRPIKRYIPGADSGTLDFFVSEVFSEVGLADLSKETQLEILASSVSAGRMRALEAQQPMAERSTAEITELLIGEVVKPSIVRSWLFTDSILRKDEILAEIAQIPNGQMHFQSWISWDFITSSRSSDPGSAGVRTAILGSLWVLAVCILFSLPLGVGAAIYLEEYAVDNWFSRMVDTNINNLAGVPSIIYGLLGLAIFVARPGTPHQWSISGEFGHGHGKRPHSHFRRSDARLADLTADHYQCARGDSSRAEFSA